MHNPGLILVAIGLTIVGMYLYPELDRLHIGDRELRIAAIYSILDDKKEAYHWQNKSKFVGFALYELTKILVSNINKRGHFRRSPGH